MSFNYTQTPVIVAYQTQTPPPPPEGERGFLWEIGLVLGLTKFLLCIAVIFPSRQLDLHLPTL